MKVIMIEFPEKCHFHKSMNNMNHSSLSRDDNVYDYRFTSNCQCKYARFIYFVCF